MTGPDDSRPSGAPEAPLRVGLVLGAGGSAGAAFHAGTLLALEQDLGWDPRTADVMVGSSAGSIVGGMLRAGLSTDDLAAWGTSTPPSSDRDAVRRVLDRMDDAGLRFVRPRLRFRLPSREWWRQVAGRSDVGAHTGVLSLLPHGVIDATSTLRQAAPLLPEWPDSPLYVNAVRATDARRVVFGRDAFPPVADAIAASCAIPGLFRPVRINGHWYIDGGAHSPTNADVLATAGVDVAVVLSPMSSPPSIRAPRLDSGLRYLFHRMMRREMRTLAAAGIDVVAFEPSRQTLSAMGWNSLDRSRAAGVVRSAFVTSGVGRFAGEPPSSVLNRLRRRRSTVEPAVRSA